MAVIDPCRVCGAPVSHDGTEYPHNILCAQHRTEEIYRNKLNVAQNLLDHVREHDSDCGDPDCEIHSPWVIEDERERYCAISWYIAGAKSTTSDFEELIASGIESRLASILDEQLAPDLSQRDDPSHGLGEIDAS